MTEKGKFIVFYGINNLGKTLQAKLLTKNLRNSGHKSEYLKYGIYDLKPSGELLNEYLRKGNPYDFSAREFQICHALNRTQYEPILKEKLDSGKWIVGEDYKGTGIAWGIGAGVDKNFLVRLNSNLIEEDLSILFDGERFSEGIEKNHLHEKDSELTEKVRQIHLELAKTYDWKIINANRNIKEIEKEIWSIIFEKFFIEETLI
jgi:thymidylate kinase